MLRNGLEPWHLLVVAVVVILMFGSKRLPDTARALGKSLRILKSETRAMKDDDAPTAQTTESATPGAAGQPEPRTIQTASGETATARPVGETSSTMR
ncbi:Sec-independent protein translocase subunit TatA [Actinacidiphila oryziradicis]|uniref:Sec-independent protein translocase protein TatA n=1 Tax=Actinacidiphila oryziradicis TaxID=2571141 RepID=A0A4U0SN53_9ACTN|nr:Sec-independent protein translocase subunit TatA [Actinacidiphila oryziradicis]TKA11176.1 Sec-independent protein translocase subunit TatA [Actinacidiphila oryziradicis]